MCWHIPLVLPRPVEYWYVNTEYETWSFTISPLSHPTRLVLMGIGNAKVLNADVGDSLLDQTGMTEYQYL